MRSARGGPDPARRRISRHSGSTGTASRSRTRPVPEAVAISSRPPASPPSVGSCIAWTSTASRAAAASLTTLMPGENSSPRAASTEAGETDASASLSPASRARMDAPSMAIPLVTTSASPGRAPEVSTTLLFSTSPSIAPAATGRGRPYVTSVWPPTRLTPSDSQASRSCRNTPLTVSGVLPSGSISVTMNHRGAAPMTAMSLALTCTAYQPMRSVAKVMGSVVATRYRSPRSISAASSPGLGPSATPGPPVSRPSRSSDNRSSGSFPALSLLSISGPFLRRRESTPPAPGFRLGGRNDDRRADCPRAGPPPRREAVGDMVQYASSAPSYRGRVVSPAARQEGPRWIPRA